MTAMLRDVPGQESEGGFGVMSGLWCVLPFVKKIVC